MKNVVETNFIYLLEMRSYLNGDVETMTSLLRHLQRVTAENGTPNLNPQKTPSNENSDPNFSVSSIA